MHLHRKPASDRSNFRSLNDRHRSDSTDFVQALYYRADKPDQRFANQVCYQFKISSFGETDRATEYAVDIDWKDVVQMIKIFAEQNHFEAQKLMPYLQHHFDFLGGPMS